MQPRPLPSNVADVQSQPSLCICRKYESGAVGQFTHAVALQGQAYSCEFEVYADGYQLKLQDPYNNPTLLVRRPGDDHEEVHRFSEDDPFFSEVSNFIDCVSSSLSLSSEVRD